MLTMASLVTGHADCLIDICLQAYPVEDVYQGAEIALEPFGVQRADHPVIRIKYRREILPPPFAPFSSLAALSPFDQCRTTASTTTLNIVGDSGSPYIGGDEERHRYSVRDNIGGDEDRHRYCCISVAMKIGRASCRYLWR